MRRSCSPSAFIQRARRRRWGRVHTARGSVPSALRVWSSARREDNATSRGTLRACLACATRDRDWGHMSRGWRWIVDEATTTLLDGTQGRAPTRRDRSRAPRRGNSLPPRDRRRALRAAAPTAFESLDPTWRLRWQKAMRALCRAKSAAFFADCLRDPATMVAETLSRDATLTMLQRYAIFDRWSAAWSAHARRSRRT